MRIRSLAVALCGLAIGSNPSLAQELAGCWAGTVGKDGGRRRAAIEFTGSSPSLTGALHVLGRRIDSDTVRELSVSGNAVRFVIPADSGTPRRFEGTVADGRLTGTLTRDTTTGPFSFERVTGRPDPALPLIGYWSGGLYQVSVLALRMGLEVVPAPCGQVLVMLDSPDQQVDNMPLTGLRVTNDSLFMELAYVGGSFRGAIAPGASAISGDWMQGGATLTLKFERADSVASFARPQDPKPPFPYVAEEVTYQNARDGTKFAGTLTIPEGEGPFPAVVMITGSGAQDRNESIMGHRPFMVIADHLTRNGIAVLRSDDRGVGGSTGNVMSATIDDNAGDVLAAVDLLKKHEKIDARRVGLVGHSEGGWVGPLVASRGRDVAFVVMLAGPAVSGEEILYAQTRLIAKAGGASDVYLDANEAFSRRIYTILKNEPDSAKVVEAVRALVDTIERVLPADQAAALDSSWSMPGVQTQFEQGIGLLTTTWFRYLLTYEPAPALDALRVPVLALFGELDLQVPPDQSVPILRRLWADHPDATIHVFPKLNHLFQTARTGMITEYGAIEETIAPEVLEMMATWIKERVSR